MKNIVIKNDLRIEKALNYIKNTDFSQLNDGRIELFEGCWANLQTYNTKEDALFEAHRKYIDIQYIISGKEKIGKADYSICKNAIPYDEEKDIEFLTTESFEDIEMSTGDFLILYPKDAHRPSISIDKTTQVRKIVVKIPVI